ncbi:MAG: hypothetical protein NZ898_14865 [Myxococcota bacterium]|nr:hypothetical protein [Myxococcota bacterium]MDW8361131.1 hypothetical protein [Myxococcales bacterium]
MTLGLKATFVERKLWPAIEARLAAENPLVLETLRHASWHGWVSAFEHEALASAAAAEIGLDALRALSASRLDEAAIASASGPIGPPLRSWTRAYAGDLRRLARVGPWLWRSTTRNAGAMTVAHEDLERVVLRVSDCALLASSPAWQALLAGLGDAVLALGGVEASINVGSPAKEVTELVATRRVEER